MRSTVTLATALALAGCGALFEPPPREFVAALDDISVPAAVAAEDPAPVVFSYESACGSRSVTLDYSAFAVTVAVIGSLPRNAVCATAIRHTPFTFDIPAELRGETFTVRFRGAGQPDTVAVIQRAPVS